MCFGCEPVGEQARKRDQSAMREIYNAHDAEYEIKPLGEQDVRPAQEHAVDDELQ